MSPRARIAAVFGCATAFVAIDAAADDFFSLLVADNVAALCREHQDGKAYVDPLELFDLMLDRGQTPHAYRTAAFGAFKAFTKKTTPSPLDFARHLVSPPAPPPQPPPSFGLDDGSPAYKAADKNWEKQVEQLVTDLENLQATGRWPFLRPSGGPAPTLSSVFQEDKPFKILCAAPVAALPPGDGTFDPLEHIRVASTKKGMGLIDRKKRRSASTLKKVDAAKVSYRDDFENDASVFSIDGVVGVQIPLSDPKTKKDRAYIDLLPYVAYKRQKPGGGSKVEEIHRAAPGLMLSYRQYVGWMPFEFFLSGEGLFDIEQRSEQIVADASFSPAFAIGGGDALFGQSFKFGQVLVFPDLDANARVADVVDAGRNPDLKTGHGYLGLGGEASLRFSLSQPAAFTPFALKLGYEHLEFVAGDINRERARRLDIELTYAFPDFPNLTATIGYKSGQDMSSYQNEDALQFSVGLRY